MKPTRTLGKSALWRNPQGPAFGRGKQIRRHALDRKRPQSLVLKLKLLEQLRTIRPPKKQGLKLHSQIAKAKPSPHLRRINLKRNQRIHRNCGGVCAKRLAPRKSGAGMPATQTVARRANFAGATESNVLKSSISP